MEPSFCGWYFKVQSSECSLALIPAVHGSAEKVPHLYRFCGENRAKLFQYRQSGLL